MKKKLVKIPLVVVMPPEYKWLARQPYGEWTAFVNKPTIHTDDEGNQYWAVQDNEFIITTHGEQGGEWKKSLQRIS